MTTIAVIGAGPGLGAAVARRFGREGYDVALISRDRERADALAADVTGEGFSARGFAADVRDPKALEAALDAATATLGPIEVLQYSPVPHRDFMRPVLETGPADLVGPIEFSVYGPVAAVRQVLPGMRALGRGTILFVNGGTAVVPHPERAGTSIAFAAECVRPSAARHARRRRHPCRAAHHPRRDHFRSPEEGPGRARGHPVEHAPGPARVPALRRRPRQLTPSAPSS